MKNLNKSNYKGIVLKLIPAFVKAGRKSIALSGSKLKIFTKPDNTPVSNGDLAVDKILQTAIAKITPDIEIVSEETIQRNKVKKRDTFWLIDPIDGTSSYIKNKDEFPKQVFYLQLTLHLKCIHLCSLYKNWFHQ